MAALVKNDEKLIIDEDRIEEVISKVKNFGESCGLSPEISEPLWRKLIDLSIEHEFKELDSHKFKLIYFLYLSIKLRVSLII